LHLLGQELQEQQLLDSCKYNVSGRTFNVQLFKFSFFNSEATLSPSDSMAASIAATLSSSAELGRTDATANPSS